MRKNAAFSTRGFLRSEACERFAAAGLQSRRRKSFPSTGRYPFLFITSFCRLMLSM